MKAALVSLAIGAVAGLLTFTGQTDKVAAEVLFVVGFATGLALLLKDIFGGVPPRRQRP